MEKVKINYKELFIKNSMFILIPIFIALMINPSNVLNSWVNLAIAVLLYVVVVGIITFWISTDKFGMMYMNEQYFMCFTKKNENRIIWDDLLVDSIHYRWLARVRIFHIRSKSDPSFKYEICFYNASKIGLVEMIQKYTPKDHFLYKEVLKFYPELFKL